MEQINKVLASTAQAFTTAEQKQARDNIAAQVSGDYAYNSAISAKQDSSAMSSYVPFSSISADANSAITSINGSSVGKFSGCSANNNITGNGTTASPLGLSGRVGLESHWGTSGSTAVYDGDGFGVTGDNPLNESYYRGSEWKITTKGDSTHWHYLGVSGGTSLFLNYNSNYYINRLTPSSMTLTDEWYPARYTAQYALGGVTLCDSANSATLNTAALTFADSAGTSKVDRSSIDRWNSGVWNESGNSVSTGFGGNQVDSASQYNDGAGNWACRTVKMSGLPDQNLYGFQSKPNGTGTAYMVNPAGAFIQYQPTYFCYLYHKTGATVDVLDTSFYPTGLTANARLDFVNLCSAATANIKTDTFHGDTADMDPGMSATMWYIASADVWTDGTNTIPV